MRETVSHSIYGNITYEENFWSGKRVLLFGDVELTRKKKNIYVFQNGENEVEVKVKGGYLGGVKLLVAGEEIVITPAPKWYEIACSVFIFVFVCVWSNSEALVSVFPIVGGAIGGGISGVGLVASLLFMKKAKTIGGKLLAWLITLVATLLICFVIALGLIALVM